MVCRFVNDVIVTHKPGHLLSSIYKCLTDRGVRVSLIGDSFTHSDLLYNLICETYDYITIIMETPVTMIVFTTDSVQISTINKQYGFTIRCREYRLAHKSELDDGSVFKHGTDTIEISNNRRTPGFSWIEMVDYRDINATLDRLFSIYDCGTTNLIIRSSTNPLLLLIVDYINNLLHNELVKLTNNTIFYGYYKLMMLDKSVILTSNCSQDVQYSSELFDLNLDDVFKAIRRTIMANQRPASQKYFAAT